MNTVRLSRRGINTSTAHPLSAYILGGLNSECDTRGKRSRECISTRENIATWKLSRQCKAAIEQRQRSTNEQDIDEKFQYFSIIVISVPRYSSHFFLPSPAIQALYWAPDWQPEAWQPALASEGSPSKPIPSAHSLLAEDVRAPALPLRHQAATCEQ